MFTQRGNKGFTLVELAIVLFVAALAIAAAVQGMQMLENSRIKSTISQVAQLQSAVGQFRSTFNGLPGDIADGHTRVNGCTAACENTYAGANDNKVGDPAWNMTDFQSASISAANTTAGGETVLFWYELAQLKLFPGITNAGVTGGAAAFGTSLPAAAVGGGFLVGTSDGAQAGAAQGRPAGAGVYDLSGLIVALAPTPAALTTTVDAQALTPKAAYQIDRTMDDGAPNTGTVQAYGVTASCYGGAAPYVYASGASKDCGLYFLVSSPEVVDGVCGDTYKSGTVKVSSVPAADLCKVGTASAVTGAQKLAWTCDGSNGGIKAGCTAIMSLGSVTALSGTATVTPLGEAAVPATIGMALYEGDVVTTAAASGATITFEDNAAFTLGESTTLTVDDYSHNVPVDPQSPDRSFFSIAQGVFSYVGGLIDSGSVPGTTSVNINTPTGSIGIRGTAILGDIKPVGSTSINTVLLVSGKIDFTNSTGKQSMDNVGTLLVRGYQGTPTKTTGIALSSSEIDTTFSSLSLSNSSGYSELKATAGEYYVPGSYNPPADGTPSSNQTPPPQGDGKTGGW